jgi:hypothetical protein
VLSQKRAGLYPIICRYAGAKRFLAGEGEKFMHTYRAWRGGSLAAALVALSALISSARADVSDFVGSWTNTDPATSGITRVVVSPAGGNHVNVQVFGACHPTDCDWGTVAGHSYVEDPGSTDVRSVAARFNPGFASELIILRKAGGSDLRFEVLTDFADGSGRRDYDMSGHLTRAAGWGGGPGGPGGPGWPPGWGGGPGGGPGGPGGPGLASEDCIGFDPGAVTASFVGGAWKVVQGSMWMLDFGGNQAAAQQAAGIIHHYHFNQQCFVKRPNAAMMYWKTGNHVSHGSTGGQDCIGLDPMNVTVANPGGSWKVVDGANWLLDYGPDHAAADQARAVIQTYHLNRQCFVARPNAPMMYWLAH